MEKITINTKKETNDKIDLKQIRERILDNTRSSVDLTGDYLDNLLFTLKDFRLSDGSRSNFHQSVINSINKMLPLKNDFEEFVKIIFKYQETVNLDEFYDFFEKLITFLYKPKGQTSWTRIDFDNYKFFIYELFLCFITTLLELKKYKEASFYIHSQYFFSDNSNMFSHSNIGMFNHYIISLDEIRNKELNLRRTSITADLIKERVSNEINFIKIIETDLILYYITTIENHPFSWFPRCSIYYPRFSKQIKLFERMVSLEQFNRIKVLFRVRDISGLKEKISNHTLRIEKGVQRHNDSFNHNIPFVKQIINLDKIGSL